MSTNPPPTQASPAPSDAGAAANATPVGDGNYVVRAGDCLESIGFDHGLMPDTIWNHPNNEAVRAARTPNDLLPGDRLFVPEIEQKTEDAACEQTHTFRRRGVPSMLKLRLTEADGEPRADLDYVLTIDGTSIEGTTDQDGRLEHPIPPNAQRAELLIEGEAPVELDLGHIDPVESISGVQARLVNLGFDCGGERSLGDKTRAAIRKFQARHNLETTGEPDDETRNTLKDVHGS